MHVRWTNNYSEQMSVTDFYCGDKNIQTIKTALAILFHLRRLCFTLFPSSAYLV